MPYDLYWHGSLSAYWIYRKKYKLETKAKADEINIQSWFTGFYVLQAIGSAFSKTAKYPDKPVELNEPEMSDAEKFKAWAEQFNILREEKMKRGKNNAGQHNRQA